MILTVNCTERSPLFFTRFAKDTPGLMRACFPKGDGPGTIFDIYYTKIIIKNCELSISKLVSL